MRAKNRCEQFISDEAGRLSEGNVDPFMFGAGFAAFMQELARAVAQTLGESAPPVEVLAWTNTFYAKLAEVHAGVQQGVRIMPKGAPPEPMPGPDEVEAYAARLVQGDPRQQQLVLDTVTAAPDVMLTHWQIRDARLNHVAKLRQEDVARALGVPQSTISRWENHNDDPAKRPSAEQCVALRWALNLPTSGDPR